MRLAYVVSRFPVLTETFIVREILELESLGGPVELFAVHREHPPMMHDAARRLLGRVHFPRPGLTLATLFDFIKAHPEQWNHLVHMTLAGHRSSSIVAARALSTLPVAVAWAQQMRGLGVDHVHAHFGTYPALAALVAAELQGINFSFTVHAHDLFADNHMLTEKARRARFVVTISEFNRLRLLDMLGEDDARRVHVVHCGVDTDTFGFEPRRIDQRPHAVLSVAALREYKGLHHLVEACRLLGARAPEMPFECRIVGDGPQRTSLERQIRESRVDGIVRLVGARDEAMVKEFLGRADTFVLPGVVARNGYMDGIPVALMEAMANGLPVVASRISGIPELVRDGQTGLLVPPGRPEALCDAILRCWSEPRAAAVRARRARTLVEQEYDVRKTTRQLAGIFVDSVAGSRSGHVRDTQEQFEPQPARASQSAIYE